MIAVRLGISKKRVETAVTLWKTIPKEFSNNVVFKTQSANRPDGRTIGAGVASQIVTLSKSYGFGRKEKKQLFKQAQRGKLHQRNVRHLSKMLNSGTSLQNALSQKERRVVKSIDLVFKRKALEKFRGKKRIDLNSLVTRSHCSRLKQNTQRNANSSRIQGRYELWSIYPRGPCRRL